MKPEQSKSSVCYCQCVFLDNKTLFIKIKQKYHATIYLIIEIKISTKDYKHNDLQNAEFVKQLSPLPNTNEAWHELNDPYKDKEDFLVQALKDEYKSFFLSITEMEKLFELTP